MKRQQRVVNEVLNEVPGSRFGWSDLGAWLWSVTGASAWWPGVGPWWDGDGPEPVEEPPFVPFDLGALGTPAKVEGLPVAPAKVIAPATAARQVPPATLAELGLPSELATGLEVTLKAMGATRDGQVIGFRFRTPDGTHHPLRIDEAA